MTVKNPSIKLNQTEATLVVNETVKLTATTAPKSAASSVTYTTSDEKVATVANDGTVKAVAAGEATITATEKCGTKPVTATAKVTVKKVVLDSVVPEATDVVTATVKGDTKDLKKTDFAVASVETKQTVAVTDMKVDDKNKTKVSLTLAGKLTDAKEYGVTLDGVTKTFVASDGKVDSIAVDPVQIPYGNATEINLVAKDTKGITVNKMKYGHTDPGFSFTFTKCDGTLNSTDGTLTLNKIGSTAEGKISYTSSDYNADGTPKVKKEQNITITAVDQAAISNYAVRIGSKQNEKFDKLKDDTKLSMGKVGYAYIQIKDANGKEVANFGDYTVESSDNAVFLLGSKQLSQGADKKSAYVQITPSATGTAYIVVKKKGTYCTSLPVNVVAKREPGSMTIDNTSFELSETAAVNDTKKVTAKVKDQYGDDFDIKDYTLEAVCTSTNADITVEDVNKTAAGTYYETIAKGKNEVTFKGANIKPGTYTWDIKLKVNDSLTLAQPVTIMVNKVDASADATYKMVCSASTLDTAVSADWNDPTKAPSVTVKLAEYKGSAIKEYKDVSFTVEKDGKVVTGACIEVTKKDGTTTVTPDTKGVYGSDAQTLKLKALSGTASDGTAAASAVEKLSAGTYKVIATYKDAKNDDKKDECLITVTDSDSAKASVVQAAKVTESHTGKATAVAANQLTITFGDYVYTSDTSVTDKQDLTVTKVEGSYKGVSGGDISSLDIAANDSATINKVTFAAYNGHFWYLFTADAGAISITNKNR